MELKPTAGKQLKWFPMCSGTPNLDCLNSLALFIVPFIIIEGQCAVTQAFVYPPAQSNQLDQTSPDWISMYFNLLNIKHYFLHFKSEAEPSSFGLREMFISFKSENLNGHFSHTHTHTHTRPWENLPGRNFKTKREGREFTSNYHFKLREVLLNAVPTNIQLPCIESQQTSHLLGVCDP